MAFDASRPDGFGAQDLSVSFRDEDGNWSEARNLGPNVNTESDERRASVSTDGKYLFFESKILDGNSRLPDPPMTLGSLREFLASPENGGKDFYWVDAAVIAELRPESPQ